MKKFTKLVDKNGKEFNVGDTIVSGNRTGTIISIEYLPFPDNYADTITVDFGKYPTKYSAHRFDFHYVDVCDQDDASLRRHVNILLKHGNLAVADSTLHEHGGIENLVKYYTDITGKNITYSEHTHVVPEFCSSSYIIEKSYVLELVNKG